MPIARPSARKAAKIAAREAPSARRVAISGRRRSTAIDTALAIRKTPTSSVSEPSAFRLKRKARTIRSAVCRRASGRLERRGPAAAARAISRAGLGPRHARIEHDVHAVDEPGLAEQVLGGEDVGDEDVAARGARHARELQDPADRRPVAHAARRRARVGSRSRAGGARRTGSETKTEPVAASSARPRRRACRVDQPDVAHGGVAAPVDAEDLHDLAAAVVDDGRSRSRPARRTRSARETRGRSSAATRTPATPVTTKSLRPETAAAASRKDAVTLRLAWWIAATAATPIATPMTGSSTRTGAGAPGP